MALVVSDGDAMEGDPGERLTESADRWDLEEAATAPMGPEAALLQPECPASSTGSTASKWGVTPLASAGAGQLSLGEFKRVSLDSMKLVCQTFGGVGNFVQQQLNTHEKRQSFFNFLIKSFPMDPTVEYHQSNDLPIVMPEDLSRVLPAQVHVAMLSYSALSPPKADPEGALRRVPHQWFHHKRRPLAGGQVRGPRRRGSGRSDPCPVGSGMPAGASNDPPLHRLCQGQGPHAHHLWLPAADPGRGNRPPAGTAHDIVPLSISEF